MAETQQSSSRPSTAALKVEQVQFLAEKLREALPTIQGLGQAAKELEDEVTNDLMQLALSMKFGKGIDREALEAFKKRPFTFTKMPGKPEGWYYLLMPRFVDMQIGYLDKQDLSYNHFIVNRWGMLLGEIPELIKKELGFKPPPDLQYRDGIVTGSQTAVDDFAKKYSDLIASKKGKRLVARPKRHFELLAALYKEGASPIDPKPVPKEVLVERKCDIELTPYQKEAWKTVLEWSNVGIFWPPNIGKSYSGVWMLAHVKPPHLVIVPTVLLKETWEQRITAHTDLKLGEEVEVLTSPTALKRYGDRHKRFGLKIFEEVHHLPADELSRLATIPCDVSVGITATPQREDHREEYIFAFTGKPFGLNWEYFRKLNLIRNPVCHVWIVKSVEAKIKQVGELARDRKTIVFCDSIELGTIVSKRYDIPHVHGATKKDRLKTIQESPFVVVSRVGDEGISIPDAEVYVEISWLGRSRRQQAQRFTRTLHSLVGKNLSDKELDELDELEKQKLREPEYNILMTPEEYAKDRQRLFSVMDRGFKVEIHREGVSERQFARTETRQPRFSYRKPANRSTPSSTSATAPVKADTVEIPDALRARLPYIGKTIDKLDTTMQKRITIVILANPEKEYTVQDLAVATSYEPENISDNARLKQLVVKRLIKKTGPSKYQAAL